MGVSMSHLLMWICRSQQPPRFASDLRDDWSALVKLQNRMRYVSHSISKCRVCSDSCFVRLPHRTALH